MKFYKKVFYIILLLLFNSQLFANTNLALNGTVEQSSTGYGGVPQRAIDDDTNGVWGGGSITHTKPASMYDWWLLDLGSEQDISKIELFNRTDACCVSRLKNVFVMVSNTPFTTGTDDTALQNAKDHASWKAQVGTDPGALVSFETGGISGRYVLIQKSGDEKTALSLAEVKVWGTQIVQNTSDICYEKSTKTCETTDSFGSCSEYKTTTVINNINKLNEDLEDVFVYIDTSSLIDFPFGNDENCSVNSDGVKGENCEEDSNGNSMGPISIFNSGGWTFNVGNITTTDEDKSVNFYKSSRFFDFASMLNMMEDFFSTQGALQATYKKDGVIYTGAVQACAAPAPGYCQENDLTEGFHIIDPNGGDDSDSFEIYCDRSDPNDIKDVLKLTMSKEMNTAEFSNFTFNSSISSDKNYYNSDHTKTYINYIRINANTLEVIPDNSEGFYNGYFSSLNLRGTPFTFDWDEIENDDIAGCDLEKMRLDYDETYKTGGQTLKINPKKEDVYRCFSGSLKLKLLNEYKYLTYSGSEVLKNSCKEISANLPDAGEYENITGYYYIDPKKVGRENNQNLSNYRPFVTYCMEVEGTNSEDLYSWTMFLNLDGKRTTHHDDISNGVDTCSNLGLIFFVPDTKATFGKVRDFLYKKRREWQDYTGKMGEYFTDRDITGWGGPKTIGNTTAYFNEAGRYYWPYGPMGLYYDDGGSRDWKPYTTGGIEINSKQYGYDLTSTSEVDGISINIAHLPNGKGWKTTLSDLNISEDFWITDKASGTFTNSAPNCPESNTTMCYLHDGTGHAIREPNGDYDRGNWMHFWADDNGDIYHYNDQNGDVRYIHDHYMCIAEDNYETFARFGLTNGPFTVVESGQTITDGQAATSIDTNITTKIVNQSLDFDIVIFNSTRTNVDKDQNISAGLFLSTIVTDPIFGESVNDLHYFGKIGATNPDFDTSTGSAYLGTSTWPGATNKISKANQKLFFQFKYCAQDNLEWTQCWDNSSGNYSCSYNCEANDDDCVCKTSESDPFALRPKNFALASVDGVLDGSTLVVKADDINISYVAYDNDGNPSLDYNVSFNDLNTSIALEASSLSCAEDELYDINTSTYNFADGSDTHEVDLRNIGVYKFVIAEKSGEEFALVDLNDTAPSDRYITPNTMTLTIKPHHFRISSVANPNSNTDGNFTYLATSTDLDSMAATLDVNITAENWQNGTATNYTDNCYASNFKLDVNYSVPTGVVSNNIFYILKDKNDNNITLANNQTTTTGLSFIKAGDLVPKELFTDDVNGSAHLVLKFNFGRETDVAKNPFIITLEHVNISDDSTAMVIDTNNSDITDVNATFVYGRAAGPKRAGSTNCVDNQNDCDSSKDSPRIVFQIYNDDSANIDVPALNGATHDGTQDSRWWTSPFHNKDGNTTDGNVTITSHPTIVEVTSGGGVSQKSLVKEQAYKYRVDLNYDGSQNYVKNAYLKHYPSPWLVYDPTNATANFNTFNHSFITEGWSGKKEDSSTTTSTTKAAHKTNRRVIW